MKPPRTAISWAAHVVVGALVVGLVGANWIGCVWQVPLAAACLAVVGALVATSLGHGATAMASMVACALLVGLGWGCARMDATRVQPVAQSAAADIRGIVETTPVAVGGRMRVRVRVVGVALAPSDLTAGSRLLVEYTNPRLGLRPGNLVRCTGTARPAASRDDPGWWRRYLERQMIGATLRAQSVVAVGRRGGVLGLRDSMRTALAQSAGRGLHGDVQTLVRGMALGGGGDLSSHAADDMRRAGIWHLLAVSGQNIAFVVLAMEWLTRACGLHRRTGKVMALACICVYCLACDGGASVARAGIVGSLVVWGELLDRERDRGYLTIVGLAVLLAIQPRAIADPGLQLSFAAVAGLLMIAPTLRVWLGGFVGPQCADYIASSIAATVATAPISIANFGSVSLVGIGVNVLVAPLAGPVVIAALVGALAGSVSLSLGVVPTLVAGLGAWAIAAVAHWGAAIPWASSTVPFAGIAVAVIIAAAVPVARWWLWAANPMRPATGRAFAATLCVAGMALVWTVPGRRGTPWPAVATLTVLDVGQGDAILLRSPDGAAALIDTGPSGDPSAVLARLRAAGVKRLSAVVLTHDQADHDGALADVLRQTSTALLVAPLAAGVSAAVAARERRDVWEAAAGDRVRVGVWTLDVLWPPATVPASTQPNDSALVVRATSPGLSVLLTSDAEGQVLRRLDIGHVDVIKVSHHGSDDPVLGAILSRVRPTVGLISVGARNPFGHPTRSTLATLQAFQLAVRRTDLNGSIDVVGLAGGVRITTER